MEAIAALSLACSVIQVVDAAKTAAETIYQIYKHGTSVNSKEIRYMTERLQSLNLSATVSDPDLSPIARDLKLVSDELLDQLSSLESLGKRDVLKKTYQTWRKGSKIEKLQAKLDRYERILDTGLLSKLSERHHAGIVAQSDGFAKLDAKLQQFIQNLADGYTRLEDVFRQESSTTRQHITSQEEETRALLQRITLKAETGHQKQRFLESFKFPTMNARCNAIAASHPKTFQWIFDTNTRWPSLKDWLASDRKIYLIEGVAASGKSTLMKFVAENPDTGQALRSWFPSVKILSHYFWLSGNALQRNMRGFLCSIVHQILSSDDDALVSSIQPGKDTVDDWSTVELTNLARKLLSTNNCCLFVDGLDEFDRSEDPRTLRDFINEFIAQPNAKMCISTRPEQSILGSKDSVPKIRVQDLTEPDIRSLVVAELTAAQESGELTADHLKRTLISEIVDRAQGVILWVKLALRSIFDGLQNGATQDELMLRISRMPSDLNRLYEDFLHRLGDDLSLYRTEAALYLQVAFLNSDWSRTSNALSGLGLFMFLAARHYNQLQDFRYTEEYLSGRLLHTSRRIRAVGGGFLQLKGKPPTPPSWSMRSYTERLTNHLHAGEDSELARLMRIEVSFIHRTARDFLLEAPSGQSILGVSNIDTAKVVVYLIDVEMVLARNLMPKWTWRRGRVLSRIIERLDDLHSPFEKYSTLDLYQHLRSSMLREARQIPGHDPSETKIESELALARQGNFLIEGMEYESSSWAMDFLGLTIESGSSHYFEHFVKPLLGSGGDSEGKLSAQYIDYLLLCAIKRPETSDMMDALLGAGANMYASLYLPPWRPHKTYPAARLANVSLLSSSTFADKLFEMAVGSDGSPRAPFIFSAERILDARELFANSEDNAYHNRSKCSFDLLIETTMFPGPAITAKELTELSWGQLLYARGRLVRERVVAVGNSSHEIRKVTSEQDSQELLRAYDKLQCNDSMFDDLCSEVGTDETDFFVSVKTYIEDVRSVFARLHPIPDFWEFLKETGHFKDPSDPAVTQKPIKRFRDGIDPADYPDF